MQKIDHVRKTVYIIVGILTIISLVFTLCKKIGLCAEGSSPILFDPLPYIYGNYIGYSSDPNSSIATDTRIQNCIDIAINNYSNYVDSMGYLVQERNNGGIQVAFFSPDQNGKIVLPSYSSDYTRQVVMTCDGSRLVYWSNNSVSDSGTSFSFKPANAIETINGETVYKTNTRSLGYVLYVHNPQLFVDSDGDQYFAAAYSPDIPVGPQGHTKGGILSNYYDSSDILEDSSDFPDPDISNSIASTISEFWDNLKGFFTRSWYNVNSWFLTIGDLIGELIDKIQEFNELALDRLEGFLTTLFETFYGWFFDWLDDLLGGIQDDTGDLVTDVHGHYQWQTGFFTESGSSNTNFWEYLDEHLTDTLEDFTENIWGHLPDIMKTPFRIFSWFYTHGLNNGEFDFMTLFNYLFSFDQQTAYTNFSNNKYGDFILDIKDFFNTFFGSISGATESSRVFFTISLDNHFGVSIPDIEINFDWYNSVKNTYLPWIMAFLYISVIWLFFKRLPDILKGVAGAESDFISGLPNQPEEQHFETSLTYKKGGVWFTQTDSGTRIRSGNNFITNTTRTYKKRGD